MKTFTLVTITALAALVSAHPAQPAVLDSRQVPVPSPEGCGPCHHPNLPLRGGCSAGTSEKIFGSCKACCRN
ncbi:hypothetical protein GGP41_002740 [Bipolaris sorokiniana]|uniref:Uncharacterized protein n=2 Tax=Cochliobolus sativus TaxID=45130 RepID=A0A8H6DXV0_COCSA|nr:uncharacterized protein COCSADRAFT_333282 [Bipolaris sorokiniana ND90Pr]EMD63935.1 hypothetical protein COCSADRAFT_333282 [Bipolaris sorokiniana ND90Pr]KAF5850530.1 hypothetical protein GGP41_002740 [Bipolaris sorokiniana]